MCVKRLAAIVWAICIGATLAAAEPPRGHVSADQSYALLVGCTTYPHLDVQSLAGSANDVGLMRDLLIQHFGFSPDHVVTLADAEAKADEARRPTRANVAREFARLADVARDGVQVVILMSGHGAQIPALNPTDPEDFEPDGLDEVFLCTDAQRFDPTTKTLPGGIVDNELGVWLRRIRDRGARVWIVVDCCHSGTIVRGADDEVVRRVPIEKLVPREAIEAARKNASIVTRSRGGGADDAANDPPLSGDLKNIVALYAAQPEESTIELPLPSEAAQPQPYGLLTYTVNEVLTQSPARLTYRELTQRVQAAYLRSGRTTPTPFLEGGDCDREVLGLREWPHRSAIRIVTVSPEMQISAGALQGLTKGSILAVLPADASDNDKPLGYVEVARLGKAVSTVNSTQYGGAAPARELPVGSRCEVAFIDYGLRKLRVFVDVLAPVDRARVAAALRALADRTSLVQVATNRRQADWILHAEGNEMFLEPAFGIDAADRKTVPRFGPVLADDKLGAWLDEHLSRIARGQNLLAMPRELPVTEAASKTPCRVRVELVRLRDKHDAQGEAVEWQTQGIAFRPGEIIGCRLTDLGEAPADVTLLFVDAGYGITSVFPRPGIKTDNRLYPGDKPVMAFRAIVDDSTVGLEHLVLIAVPGEGEAIDFSVLEQPTLPRTRGNDAVSRSLGSPLGQLLQNALYAKGRRRGGDVHEIASQQLELISWRIVPNRP